MQAGPAHGVIAVDFQNLFLDSGSPAWLPQWASVSPHAWRLLDAALYADLPVVFTRYAVRPEELRQGEAWGFDRPLLDASFEAELLPDANKRIPPAQEYRKWRFDGSDSGFLQRHPQVSTWLLVGVQTHRCVLATALGLARKGLNPVVVSDACCARSMADHQAALRVLSAGHARIAESAQARRWLKGASA